MANPPDEELRRIYEGTRTIAVVGASNDESKPGNRIPRYLREQGYRIVPVNPRGGEVLGERAYTSLREIDVPVDVVDVFRPPGEAPDLARQAVEIGAGVLWLQEGIVSDEAVQIAREGGLVAVQDVCMGATHRRLGLTKQ